MRIRWSPSAADNFVSLAEYIRSENPSAAERIVNKIHDRILLLKKFPESGRPGRMKETRELVLAPLPFIVVYRVRHDFIELIRILHAAQRWP